MIAAPVGLITFSLLHGTLSWSETQHLRTAGPDEWVRHLTKIQGRWLAAYLGGVALFPLLGMTIWWMLAGAKSELIRQQRCQPRGPRRADFARWGTSVAPRCGSICSYSGPGGNSREKGE